MTFLRSRARSHHRHDHAHDHRPFPAAATLITAAAQNFLPAFASACLVLAALLAGGAHAADTASAENAALTAPDKQVEARIAQMHTRLQISTSQEDQWLPVAQTMRDNQTALEPLIGLRHRNAASATAIDDLRSYADVTEAHAAGIRRFSAAFEPLYAAFSDSQKATADKLFRSGPNKMGAGK